MARLTGERRALAAAVFAFYAFLFLLMALQPPLPGWGACLGGLAAVYGLGFFGLVAGYFWARWYGIGLGLSGVIMAAISMWQAGLEPVLLFWGGTHLGASGVLWGASMSSAFDGRREWRERFHLDESDTHRLGKAIMRVGASLPYVVMYALAPREDAGAAVLIAAGAGLALAGTYALLRLRTWGVLALGGAAVTLAASLGTTEPVARLSSSLALDLWATGLGAAALLAAAAAPYAGPIARYLRGGAESR